MKEFLLLVFTWWNKKTIGTMVWTRRHGERVGQDEFGNTYYRTRGGAIDPNLGFQRRWVIYSGYADSTTIPPGWYGWIHNRTDVLPMDEVYTPKPWQKPHLRNFTGSPRAYRPKGSVQSGGARPRVTGDYSAWTPGE